MSTINDLLENLRDKITPAPTNDGEILKKLEASLTNLHERREIQSAIDAPVPDQNRQK